MRSTRPRTFDGERAVIPNGDIYADTVLVKTAYETRRVRFMVGIGYLDDIEAGREAIQRVLLGTTGVLHNPGPWIYVNELAPVFRQLHSILLGRIGAGECPES